MFIVTSERETPTRLSVRLSVCLSVCIPFSALPPTLGLSWKEYFYSPEISTKGES